MMNGLWRPAPLILALSLSTPWALAQTSPWYLGAAVGVTHVANIFRAADGTPEANDNLTNLTLLGGLDQPFGRQRARASVTLRDNRYADHALLNNLSYGLNLGLDWSTAERISGSVSVNSNQSLVYFTPGDAPSTTERNLERSQGIAANVRVGVVTRLTAELAVTHRQVDYSSPLFTYRENREDSVSLGFNYRFSAGLAAGMNLRHSQGSFPRFRQVALDVFEADRFKRDDIDFNVQWNPNNVSAVSARLSPTRSKHSEAKTQSVNALTGTVNWSWQPTSRIRMSTALTRDSGQETSQFSAFQGLLNWQTDYSRIVTALKWNGSYELTSKISATAGLTYAERSLSDTLAFSNSQPNTTAGGDRATAYTLGLRWVPARSTTVTCDWSQEQRRVSSRLSLPYGTQSFGCAGQFILQ